MRLLEICAGAGGQALGLSRAGFTDVTAIDIDPNSISVLNANRPNWDARCEDIADVGKIGLADIDLISAGLPSPLKGGLPQFRPSSEAAHNVLKHTLRVVSEARPKAVLLENVRLVTNSHADVYRESIVEYLRKLGYRSDWQLLHAHEFGVSQVRPRFFLIALRPLEFDHFLWPRATATPVSVGRLLEELMAADGWPGAGSWSTAASGLAPTIVAGSHERGGADLGPTGTKELWRRLHVDGKSISDRPPTHLTPAGENPRLTLEMIKLIQGFPSDWQFPIAKTAAFRLMGSACPPPVAQAIGNSLAAAIQGALHITGK